MQNDISQYKEIAPRLMGLREAMDWSYAELANKLELAEEKVRSYESGMVEIPVSYLKDVANLCGVNLTELISGDEAHLHEYSVVRKGQGLSVQRRKDYDYWNLASQMQAREMEPFLVRVPPKNKEDLNFATHKGQEFIYLLEGRLELWLGDKDLILEVGDSIYFSSRIPHALRGLDNKDALFIDVIK